MGWGNEQPIAERKRAHLALARMTAERDALLAEVERLRADRDEFGGELAVLRDHYDRLKDERAQSDAMALVIEAAGEFGPDIVDIIAAISGECLRNRAALAASRGVVQAVREWLAKAEPYPELNGNKFADLRAALAAAAVPTQDERCGRCAWCLNDHAPRKRGFELTCPHGFGCCQNCTRGCLGPVAASLPAEDETDPTMGGWLDTDDPDRRFPGFER